MEMEKLIADEYALGAIYSISDLSTSSKCYLLATNRGEFIYKQMGRADFVQIYDKVQRTLNARGLAQARIIPNLQGELMSPSGYSLFTYIPGETPGRLSDQQLQLVVRYLKGYNLALRDVPFCPAEIADLSVWDKAKSVSFLVTQADSLVCQCQLDEPSAALIRKVAAILSENIDLLQDSRKQLIHSDLGPGSVIFAEEQVRSIIDFTPEYEHELYSLAQLLYWTCLWHAKEPPASRIKAALGIYNESTEPTGPEQLLFLAYLAKACLFRAIGPMLLMLENGVFDVKKLVGRVAAIEAYLDLRENWFV